MRATRSNVLKVIVMAAIAHSASAESQASRMTQEMVHVANSMAAVSTVLLLSLHANQGEKSMGTYATKIAEANVSLVKKMRSPQEAKDLHRHLLELAGDFSLAVQYYVKGDYKSLNVARQEANRAGQKVKQEIKRMEDAGFIPRQKLWMKRD